MPLGITLGALSVSGYLTATGVARLTEATAQAPVKTQDKPAAAVASDRLTPLELSQAVLTRNIFDSSVGSMAWQERVEPLGPTPPGPDSEASDEETDGPSPAPPVADCPSDLRLSAVFMAEDQARSFGVMQRGSTPAKQVRIGGELDGVTLLMLAPTLAFVRQTDGSTCRLLLYRSVAPVAIAPVAAPAKAAPAKGKAGAKSMFSDGELEAGITPLGGDTYRVSRDLIARAMADATSAVQGVRFVPQKGEQRSNGVKVQRLTNKAVLYKLGVRNNDTLRTLNGLDLSSTDGMLSAYALLRQENTISLALMRDGSFKTLTYKIE